MKLPIAIIALLTNSLLSAQSPDPDLQQLFHEDQEARKADTVDWSILTIEDSLRRIKVYELIAQQRVKSAKDYYHAAVIFQHGTDTVSSSLAVQMMKKAIEADPSIDKWLLAAAIDRDLLWRKKPQIYGTQFVKDEQGKWSLYTIDTITITDDERRSFGVESISEQRTKAREMNMQSPEVLLTKTGSIRTTITRLKTEHAIGAAATYQTSEIALTIFGYSLLEKKRYREALKVFQLATRLYPNAYNTYDSYGECLMAMNRKKRGLRAYKKSLQLNPSNEHAQKVIDQNN